MLLILLSLMLGWPFTVKRVIVQWVAQKKWCMKLNYYPDTDSLYIDLSERPSAESREISGVLFWITMLKEIWSASTSIMLAERLT